MNRKQLEKVLEKKINNQKNIKDLYKRFLLDKIKICNESELLHMKKVYEIDKS